MRNYTNQEELYHFGVKGMKWGVRRYRNYDGSYTQAGVKRFDNAEANYQSKKSALRKAKESGSKYDIAKAKGDLKKAKRDVKKHYKHLKQDKLADKGKVRYASGETITNNNEKAYGLAKIGAISIAVAEVGYRNNYITSKTRDALRVIGNVSSASALVMSFANDARNKELRAYYAHTSNY